MRRAVLVWLVVVAGCERAERKEPAPAVCERYIEILEASGSVPPPGFPDDAFVPVRDGMPVVVGSRPIPPSDGAIAREAANGEIAGTAPAYVFADARATVDSLRRRLDPRPTTELRLLVAKPADELVAAHVAMFPRTPADLRDQLPRYTSIDDSYQGIIRRSEPCAELLRAFRVLAEGGSVELIGPETGKALRACQCKVDDLDGYVSLFMWLLFPTPPVGYLPIRPEVLDGMPGDASVGELADALAR